MQRLLSFLIALFMSNVLFAQTENYKVAMDSFQANYNADKYDEIFNRFSPEMKKALPVEKTKEFLTGLKSQGGHIESMEFISYQKTYALYKTTFAKAVMAVNISLNDQNQMNGLFIKRYEEPKARENRTVNSLSKYPEEIAEIIFSKSKDFPNNTQLFIAIIQNGKTIFLELYVGLMPGVSFLRLKTMISRMLN